jgi:hypothetical protein
MSTEQYADKYCGSGMSQLATILSIARVAEPQMDGVFRGMQE